MFVSCSTQCFARYSLEDALLAIAALEFSKVDVAIRSGSHQLSPQEVVEDTNKVMRRLKLTSNLIPAAFSVEIEETNPVVFDEQFKAICKLARWLTVATISLPAGPLGTDWDSEVRRLRSLVQIAAADGVVLTVETRMGTLTEWPDQAVKLCEKVPGLGLTLDPSHYICGPNQNRPYDHVYPYVRHVHLRDTGRTPDKLQVRVGQGELEYSRLVSLLERFHYNRLLSVDIHDAPHLPFNVESEVRKLKYLLDSLA